MSWTRVFALSLLSALLILTYFSVVESAAVPDDEPKGEAFRVFMPESDASNIFKRRSRRSSHRYQELQAEQWQHYAANDQRRKLAEERRRGREKLAEEAQDEQNERSREVYEQYREYNYDGLYPRQRWYY